MDGWLFLVIVLPLPPYWGCGRSSPSLEFISKYGSQWYKDENVNILLSTRFSRSTSSTLRLRLRPVSTSSRYGDTYRRLLAHHNHQGPSTDFEFFFFFLDSCAYAPLFLHGRQVPRLLHHHHRLLARPDRRRLCRLLDRPLPAHRWQGQTHGGLLFPEKVNVTLRDRKNRMDRDVRIDEKKFEMWRLLFFIFLRDDGLIPPFSFQLRE